MGVDRRADRQTKSFLEAAFIEADLAGQSSDGPVGAIMLFDQRHGRTKPLQFLSSQGFEWRTSGRAGDGVEADADGLDGLP